MTDRPNAQTLAPLARAASPGASLPPLTVGQSRVLGALTALLPASGVLYVAGSTGSGKSLILRHLLEQTGGRLLTAADAMRALNEAQPAHLEEALIERVRGVSAEADIICFDDWWATIAFGLVAPDRPFFIVQALQALFGELGAAGKRFVSSVDEASEDLLRGATGAWTIVPTFDRGDQRAILEHHLGRPLSEDAVATLAREYQGLNGYQLESLAAGIRDGVPGAVSGTDLVKRLEGLTRRSNLSIEEVEDIGAGTLVGSEAHIEALERTILVPLLETELARELGLKPARGVLLHGPPGAGKTTLGRLLARRMKGKFFVIDGTMFSDRPEFPAQVRDILNQAAACSPSVVFIDDADVIFRNGQSRGFVRQLLSRLDGLAAESQREVCLMMTAMNVADLPPALIRSGRVDVWIALTLPDLAQRAAIVTRYANAAAGPPRPFDSERIAALCDGFTPADLRSLVSDASAAAAYDGQLDEPTGAFDDYLADCAREIAERKRLIGV